MTYWTSHGAWLRAVALVATLVASAALVSLSVAGVNVRPVNAGLVFLLLTLLVSAYYGLRVGLASAILSNVVLVSLFLEPKFKPWADDGQEFAALPVFLVVSAIGSSLLELANTARRAEALEEADDMKMAILASISHDLKTPLATIKSNALSLRGESIEWTVADRQTFLDTIVEEADQLDKTISDLLALNRIESGTVRPNLTLESLSQIAEDAVELKSMLIGDRPLVFDVPDLTVSTDSSLMRQALANLIENAALHSRPGGSIHVNAVKRGSEIDLSVEDEGPGVDDQELPYIFNPYYRARNGKAAPNGSGLGLAIVKGFVQLCGGSVRAESDSHHSRFVIALPAQPFEEKSSRP